jgi:shikimate kinase/3-dehydroquinate synthase
MADQPLSGRRGRAIVLVGFMGAGKSTAARELSADPLDSDRLVELRAGAAVRRIFERDGEAEFRRLEEQCVLEALTKAGEGAGGGVVSLGGGALGSQAVRDALRDHTVVFLEASLEDAWERAQGPKRPLANDRAGFEQLFRQRAPLYAEAADVFVAADPKGLVSQALGAILTVGELADGTQLVWARSASGSYPVFVSSGGIGKAQLRPTGRYALITDSNVAPLLSDRFTDRIGEVVLKPGEQEKTVATCSAAWSSLARFGLGRDDLVYALGGGVTGDVGGFVAAGYQRGLRVVHFPTTLVAQVDSAYGGKTGVDLPEGKNYVGAYHQPSAVITDPDVLATLPPQERAAGMAEVIKTALIAGGELWERVERGDPVDANTVRDCARTKLAVVAEDERDSGRRQVLNLGHTIGHAIETATDYSAYRHGEAVAIGLLAAIRLSGADDLRDRVAGILRREGLPVSATGVDADAVVDLVSADKKRRGDGTIPFVFCDRPGSATVGNDVSANDLRAAVVEACR